MKNLKRALLLMLILAIGMPTVALAAYESMSEAFDNKIVKISLENGYNLLANGCIYDADPEDAIYDMVDAEGDTVGASEEGIPVYDVNVPAGTEYVYMYTWQDPDNNGAFAHSCNGNYSVGTATVTLSDGMDCVFDGSGYNVWTNIAQYSDDMSTVNLWVTDANGEDPYEQTIAKVKIPVAMQLEDASDEESENYGKSRVVVFNQQDNNYPFALCFHETAMDVSNVPAEDVQLSMAESFTWSVDPANIVSKTPYLRVHPIGANNITDVTWESSDSSIVSVENVGTPNTIDEEYDSCTISTAELVPHKTGVVTITVKGGDYEKSTTITVTANNCTHTDTAETIEQVEGEEKHNVITACAFCGEQVGDVTTENCADGNADGACDLCGGEVKAEEPEVNTPAVSVPDGAPFSAITTDKGGAISVVEAGELTVDPWGMGFGYTGTVYHVVIPEGASSADITLDMPFSQLMYYMDNAGKPTTIAGYTGNAVYDNDECLEPGQDGGTASFAFTAPDNNSTVITVQMELRGGKSLVKPADFDPDSSSAYYAAGPEYGDANANAYNPVCYFTFEYGSAAGGEEPECDHAETTTAYVQVEGTETHTVTVTCTCGEVISTETVACVDEDKNGACDQCEGAVVVPCEHTETTTAYDQVEGTETHTATVTCVCGEVISTETVACADADKNGKCDQCEGAVKVEEPAVPINKLTFWVNEIKVTEVSMKVGETVDAIAGCTPVATTENVVLFSSSDTEVLSVSDEEVTADGTYGHAKTTIKGEKVGEAILTAVSKTNSDVSAQLKVTVTCNHVGTETTSSCEYEGVGGGVHNTVTSVYCACGEFIGKSTSLNDVCVDENTDSKCDLCGGEVDVPVVTGPVAIYDSSKDGAWSTRIKISKLFVEGVTVKSYQWTGNACVVTLAADTPADAQVTFSYEGLSGGGGGGAVYINGSKSTRTIPLVIGEQVQVTTAASVYIGSMRDDKSVIFQLEGTEQIPVERIEINAGDGRVVAGGTKQLTATVYPENATIKDVKWSTSAATTNLTITESGKVTGQSMGMGGYYTVTATSVSNPEISASCKVFLDWKPETSIALDKETMTVKIGQPVRLTATISGTQFVTNTTATWTSSDESIATVDGGKVTGLKTGTVTITATSYYGLTATCEVTVECPHIGMETVTAYEHIDGTETHTAVNTCVCGYMLGSSTEDCADENADGKCDKCEGDVALPVYTIELDKSEASVWAFGDQQIPTGYEAYAADFPKTAELKATVKVNDVETDAAEVVWTSSDDKVATVENGVVTATGAGEAVITATVNDVAASCTVKVESFIAPVYMNVELVGEFDYSVNQPEGETARVIDLTDETQARTITISAPLYQNVNDVKTLASMQGVTWEIEGAAECVETVVNDDFTLTATFTGKPGVVSFKPVMLNGNTNVRLPIYVSNGFVTEVSIVRGDGKDWAYGEKETIGGVERDVIKIVEGSSITAVSSATNVTQTYNGWLVSTLNDSYATVSTGLSFNGASMDLSKLDVGLYSVLVRVPTYEQNYNIDYKGTNPQDQTSSEMIYIRVVEKLASGDVSGDGNINANDAVLVLQAAAGGELKEEQKAAADMNGDGTINANDAVLVLQYSAE